jgi:hypothetical protein
MSLERVPQTHTSDMQTKKIRAAKSRPISLRLELA